MSIFAHYDGVWRAEGIDGTLTALFRGVDRWFWIIPLTPERTSIGIVLDGETFRNSKRTPEDFLEQALDEQPVIMKRMRDAQRASEVHVAADFSYRSKKLLRRTLVAGGRCRRIHRSDFQQRRFPGGV